MGLWSWLGLGKAQTPKESVAAEKFKLPSGEVKQQEFSKKEILSGKVVPAMATSYQPGSNDHAAYTTEEEPAAKWRNGTRVTKLDEQAGDFTQLGTYGTVIGSIRMPETAPEQFRGQIGYFIRWDNNPGLPVFTREIRLKEVKDN